MPALEFTFGSFGDIVTLLQLAFQLRTTLNDASGTSAEVRALVADFDQFTLLVQQAKAVLQRLQPDVRAAIGAALARCQDILVLVQRKIKAFQSRMTARVGRAAWRAYWTAVAWEILGGRREIDALRARLADQVSLIQTYLSLASCHDQQAMLARADSQHVELKRLRTAIEDIPRCFGSDAPSFLFEDAGSGKLYQPFARTSFEKGSSLGMLAAFSKNGFSMTAPVSMRASLDFPLRYTFKLHAPGCAPSYLDTLWFQDSFREPHVLLGQPLLWGLERTSLTQRLLAAYTRGDYSLLDPCDCCAPCSHSISQTLLRDAETIRDVSHAYSRFIDDVRAATDYRLDTGPLMHLLLALLPDPDALQTARDHSSSTHPIHSDLNRTHLRAPLDLDSVTAALQRAPRILKDRISHEALRENIKIFETAVSNVGIWASEYSQNKQYRPELVVSPWVLLMALRGHQVTTKATGYLTSGHRDE